MVTCKGFVKGQVTETIQAMREAYSAHGFQKGKLQMYIYKEGTQYNICGHPPPAIYNSGNFRVYASLLDFKFLDGKIPSLYSYTLKTSQTPGVG